MANERHTVLNVIVEGHVLDGHDQDAVRCALAKLTGISDAAAASLLGGRAKQVKSNIDEATGVRFVTALRQIGVASRLEVVTETAAEGVRVGKKELASEPATVSAATSQKAIRRPVPPKVAEKIRAFNRWAIGASVVMFLAVALAFYVDRKRPDTAPAVNSPSSARSNTHDESELEELCKDWVFYKARIYKYSREGDSSATAEARRKFAKVNGFLSAYPESEVARVCPKFETRENIEQYMR